MKTLQKWFERLAGVTQDELFRLRVATEVFNNRPSFDSSALHTPACWRRPRRCQAI